MLGVYATRGACRGWPTRLHVASRAEAPLCQPTALTWLYVCTACHRLVPSSKTSQHLLLSAWVLHAERTLRCKHRGTWGFEPLSCMAASLSRLWGSGGAWVAQGLAHGSLMEVLISSVPDTNLWGGCPECTGVMGGACMQQRVLHAHRRVQGVLQAMQDGC